MSDTIYRTTEYQPDNRRLAFVKVTAAFLLDLCKARGKRTFAVTINALPDDVKIVGAEYDVLSDHWKIAVTSESFGKVPSGVIPPTLDPPVWTEYFVEAEVPA